MIEMCVCDKNSNYLILIILYFLVIGFIIGLKIVYFFSLFYNVGLL